VVKNGGSAGGSLKKKRKMKQKQTKFPFETQLKTPYEVEEKV